MRLQIEEEARECRKIAQRWDPRHDNYALHITRARALEWVLKLMDEAIKEQNNTPK
jgi:hypothetical protein